MAVQGGSQLGAGRDRYRAERKCRYGGSTRTLRLHTTKQATKAGRKRETPSGQLSVARRSSGVSAGAQ